MPAIDDAREVLARANAKASSALREWQEAVSPRKPTSVLMGIAFGASGSGGVIYILGVVTPWTGAVASAAGVACAAIGGLLYRLMRRRPTRYRALATGLDEQSEVIAKLTAMGTSRAALTALANRCAEEATETLFPRTTTRALSAGTSTGQLGAPKEGAPEGASKTLSARAGAQPAQIATGTRK